MEIPKDSNFVPLFDSLGYAFAFLQLIRKHRSLTTTDISIDVFVPTTVSGEGSLVFRCLDFRFFVFHSKGIFTNILVIY